MPSRRDHGPIPVLATVSAVALIVLAAVAGRDLWFFSDDWNIYADYHDGNLLEPFNGHLSLVPAGIYQLLFRTIGVGSYLPYRLCGLVALGVLAFQVTRAANERFVGPARREGGGPVPHGAVLVALVVSAVLWNSSGQMNLLFPFLMNFSIPIAALVASWWHLDRADEGDRPLRHEAAASMWVALALATSGLGLMTAAAVGVELAVTRAPWRRWAVLAPGPVLWALWYLANRDSSEISTDVGAVVAYSARMFLGATTSLGAGVTALGWLLAALLVAYLVAAGVRWRSLDARALGALAAPVTFIVFTAATRLDIVPAIPPDELRYSWAIAAYLVLAVVVIARRDPLFTSPRIPPAGAVVALVVAAGVLVVGAWRLWGDLDRWNTQVADARPGLSTVLFATEAIGADRIDPDVVIPLSYVPVTTGGYLAGVESVGSPIAGATAADLGGAPYNRRFSDELLIDQLGIRLEPSGVDDCPGAVALAPGEDGTFVLQPGQRVFVMDPGGTGSPRVGLSRFSSTEDAVSLESIGETFELTLPADAPGVAEMPGLAERWPYRMSLSASPSASVSLCAGGAG